MNKDTRKREREKSSGHSDQYLDKAAKDTTSGQAEFITQCFFKNISVVH